jgi:hypothetical protein
MGKTVKKNEKYHRKTTLTTKGGEVLTNFAKSVRNFYSVDRKILFRKRLKRVSI